MAKEIITNGNQKLSLYRWGEKSNKAPIALVHGYPDNANVWDKVVPFLSKNREVISYDVRGAGASEQPSDANPYSLDNLVSDLSAVINQTSPDQPVHLIGHDWGAIQVWEAALREELSHRIATITVAAPPLDHFGVWFREKLKRPSPKNLFAAGKQLAHSSYTLLFQLPLVPELAWKVGLEPLWPRLLNYTDGIKIKESKQKQVSRFNDASNGLGLYRHNVIPKLRKPNIRCTKIPVQLLQMEKDPFLPLHLYEGIEKFAENIRFTNIDAGHWGVISNAFDVARSSLRFIQSTEKPLTSN